MINFLRKIFCRNHAMKLIALEEGMHMASAWITQVNFYYKCPNCGAKRSACCVDETLRSISMKPKRFGLSVDDIKRVLIPEILDDEDISANTRKRIISKVSKISDYDKLKRILNLEVTDAATV